jgi:hypothetical protein
MVIAPTKPLFDGAKRKRKKQKEKLMIIASERERERERVDHHIKKSRRVMEKNIDLR